MAKNSIWKKWKTFENRIGTNYDRPTWYLINSAVAFTAEHHYMHVKYIHGWRWRTRAHHHVHAACAMFAAQRTTSALAQACPHLYLCAAILGRANRGWWQKRRWEILQIEYWCSLELGLAVRMHPEKPQLLCLTFFGFGARRFCMMLYDSICWQLESKWCWNQNSSVSPF